jgi:hypothetical protein
MLHQPKNSDIISDFSVFNLTKQPILRGFTEFSPVNVTILLHFALSKATHDLSGQRTKRYSCSNATWGMQELFVVCLKVSLRRDFLFLVVVVQ